VDNFPVLMPDNWEVSSPEDILPAPIEVLVEQGRVVRYRRLAHNFLPSDTHVWLELDLDSFVAADERPLTGLSVGFRMMSPWDNNLRLGLWGWYEEVYVEETEDE